MDIKNVHKYVKGVRVINDVNRMNDELDAVRRYNQLLISIGYKISGEHLTEDGLLRLLKDYIDYEVVSSVDDNCITCKVIPYINMNKQ